MSLASDSCSTLRRMTTVNLLKPSRSWMFLALALGVVACKPPTEGNDDIGDTGTDTGTDTGESTTTTSTTETTTDTTETTTDTGPVCGDGVRAGSEECDDANQINLDGCSTMCKWEARIAFATSSLHTGNLGGLIGADVICNMRAQAAGLPGTYMAWLTTNQGSPNSRFVKSTVPYVLRNGTLVANNWTDLTDGTLAAPISITETGGASPVGTNVCVVNAVNNNRTAFTGTGSNGLAVGTNCSNFTSAAANSTAAVGVTTSASFRWTNCANLACNNTSAIYCFQQ